VSDQLPCAASRETEYPAGETLIHEGDLGDTAYSIVSGQVRVWKHVSDGEIELARLGPGAIFGEMSLVDEKPRSASVTTVVATRVKALKRAQFLECFQQDPEFATSLLRVLLERLRETGAKLTQLQQGSVASTPQQQQQQPMLAVEQASHLPRSHYAQAQIACLIRLEGLTEPARESLPSNPCVIDRLPCRIGRSTKDQLAYNDLSIQDFEPFQISVNHLLIFQETDPNSGSVRIGIFDRGSSRGSWLDGSPLGGLMGDDTATFLAGGAGEAELVLGDQDSVFRYRLSVSPPHSPAGMNKS